MAESWLTVSVGLRVPDGDGPRKTARVEREFGLSQSEAQ